MSRHLPLLVVALAAACSGKLAAPGPSPSAGSSPAARASADPDAPLPNPLPVILARVNGQAVETRQVLPLARQRLIKGTDEERKARLPRVFREALRQYIDRELLFQEAMARGIKADDEAVQFTYDRARVQYPKDSDWEAFLDNSGFDPATFKAEIRVKETVDTLLRQAAAEVGVTDVEARARYEADRAAFPPPEGKPPGFESVKEQVRARLLEEKGEDVQGDLLRTLRAKARIEIYI